MDNKITIYFKRLFAICICFMISYVGYGIITYRNQDFVDIIFHWKYTFIDYSSILIICFLLYYLVAFKLDKNFYMVFHEIGMELCRIIKDALYQLKNKKLMIGIIILLIIVYGYQITNFTLSLDEEFQMAQSKNIVQWCYEGRFSIGILKNFFMGFGMYEPFLSNLVASIIMGFNGLLLCYLVENTGKKQADSTLSKLIFIAFFISFPSVIVEFMSFSTYCIEVSLGLTLVIISVLILDKYLVNKGKSYLLLNIVTVFFSLGVYQAMATVYITVVSIYFFIKIYKNGKFSKEKVVLVIKEIITSILLFVIAVILFFAAYKIATTMHYVQGSIDYINEFAGWDLEQGIVESLKTSCVVLYNTLFHTEIVGIAFFKWYILFGLIDIILILLFIKTVEKKVILSFLLLEILVSGFYMWLVLASKALPFRAWLSVPIVCGYVYYLFIKILEDNLNKEFVVIISLPVIILCFRQIQTTNELFINDNKRMEKDLNFAREIYDDISSQVSDISDKTIVFIGTKDLADDSTIIKNPLTDLYFGGDALGYSLWRRAQEPHRMQGLYAYLGYNLQFEAASENEIEMAHDKMNVYPLDKSIKGENGKIYVRLE